MVNSEAEEGGQADEVDLAAVSGAEAASLGDEGGGGQEGAVGEKMAVDRREASVKLLIIKILAFSDLCSRYGWLLVFDD